MYSFLYKYLVINKQLVLPGLGQFSIVMQSAKLNFVDKVLQAPQYQIHFAAVEAVPDKSLYYFLSKELGVDEWKVVTDFQNYINDLVEKIKTKGMVSLPGMGYLRNNATNTIYFIPDNTSSQIMPNIALGVPDAIGNSKATGNLVELYKTGDGQIITPELESDQLEKIVKSEDDDYWWVYAFILAMMGAAALLYYYI